MKRLFSILPLSLILVAPNAFAINLTLQGGPNGYGPYQTGVGGEFTFQISDPTLLGTIGGVGGYATTTANQAGPGVSFQTFCVEGGENIDSKTPNYTANLNNHSVYSNVQLTKGAAWLYSQFAQGTLAGYNVNTHSAVAYNYASGNRLTSAGLLQNAIWALMGHQEGMAFDLTNPFEAAAAMAIGGSYTLAGLNLANADAGTDNYGVYVLNVWDNNNKAAQDQLIYSTVVNPNSIVPDGGITAMMLGIAFTGTAFVSRRFRRQ